MALAKAQPHLDVLLSGLLSGFVHQPSSERRTHKVTRVATLRKTWCNADLPQLPILLPNQMTCQVPHRLQETSKIGSPSDSRTCALNA